MKTVRVGEDTIQFPDSMSDADIEAVLAGRKPQSSSPPQKTEPPRYAGPGSPFNFMQPVRSLLNSLNVPRIASDIANEGAPSAENIAGSAPVRYALGAASPILGGAQLALNATGQNTASDYVNSLINRNAELRNAALGGETDYAGMLGNVMNPVGLKGLGKLGQAKNLVGRVIAGSTTGAAYGGLTPVEGDQEDFAKKKVGQVTTGAAIGAIVPATADALAFFGRPAGEFIRAFWKDAPERVVRRFVNEKVGPENVQKIIAELKMAVADNSRMSPLPGYKPTTGELISHMPEASPWLAVERVTAPAPHGISAIWGKARADQEAALKAAMQTVAGTPEDLARQIASRQAASNINYKLAFDQLVKADTNLAQMSGNPYFKEAMNTAADLAKANGVTYASNPTQWLHYIKIGLDKQLQRTGDTALAASEQRAVQQLKERLTDWLDKNNPMYNAARATHQAMSRPIDQMQVGQELEGKLLGPMDNLTPGSFLRAIDNAPRTIKSATGMPKEKLEDVFNQQDVMTINTLGNVLERRLAAMKPPQPTNMSSNIAASSQQEFPSLLYRPVVIANFIMKTMSKGSSALERGIDELNTKMALDPKVWVEVMSQLPPAARERVATKLGIAVPSALIAEDIGR